MPRNSVGHTRREPGISGQSEKAEFPATSRNGQKTLNALSKNRGPLLYYGAITAGILIYIVERISVSI